MPFIYIWYVRDFLACLSVGSYACTDFYIYLISHESNIFFLFCGKKFFRGRGLSN